MSKTCKTCRYCQVETLTPVDGPTVTIGFCHWLPPTLSGPNSSAFVPVAIADDSPATKNYWCGQHKPRPLYGVKAKGKR